MAASLKELQEVRYAKALIAFNQKDYIRSARFIAQNMDKESPHTPSLELLANIHTERGDLVKAQKVYYYLIKKHYTNKILKLPAEQLNKLKTYDKPSEQAMGYIFKIASTHFELFNNYKEAHEKERDHETRLSIQERKNRVLKLSEKYFKMLKYFKFAQDSMVEYNLGLIEKEKNQNKKAMEHFEKALMAEEKAEEPDMDLSNMIQYYLGDTLIKAGQRDIATKYFKAINETTKIEALKNFSRTYLDSLNGSALAFNVGYDWGSDANPFNLDPRNVELDDFNQASNFSDVQANMYYNSDKDNDWMYSVNLNYNELEYKNYIFRNADSRNFKVSTEFKFYDLPHKVNRYALSYLSTDNKQDDIAAWRPFSDTIFFSPYWDFYTKSGIYTLGLPHTRISYKNISDVPVTTSMQLVSFSWLPWTTSRFLNPSLTLNYGQTHSNRDDIISRSNNLRVYLSNQTSLTENNTVLFSLSHVEDEAESVLDSYYASTFSFSLLHDLSRIISGAVFDFNWSTTELKRDSDASGDKISKSIFTFGLDFYF